MSYNKNIDRLFQEKFKDFEISPNDAVWKKIKAYQNRKQKRKVLIIPFWFRLGGTAALIALLFTVGSIALKDGNKKNTILTNSEIKSKGNKKTLTNTPVVPDDAVVLLNMDKKTSDVSNSNKKSKDSNSDKPLNSLILNNTIVGVTQKPTQNTTNPLKAITQNIRYKKEYQGANTFINKNTSSNNSILSKKGNQSISQNTVIEKSKTNDLLKEKQMVFNTTIPNIKNGKDDIKIAENNYKSITSDKILVEKEGNTTSKKSILESIKKDKKESLVDKSNLFKKWNLTPTVAPVYYSSIGNGSPIDSQYSDNKKEGLINLSYGIQVSYNLNKKLSIRSGINKVDLSYNTEGIAFGYASIADGKNKNIDYATNASTLSISDYGNDSSREQNSVSTNLKQEQTIGLLNQQIGYLEVPLEAKYALVDKKLSIHAIGGVSTLFLENNNISIETIDYKMSIGKANNLNTVSFSGNLGVGVDYKLFDKLRLNIEPIFKYQFNTFSENSGNFKPYYLGIYSGLSFNF